MAKGRSGWQMIIGHGKTRKEPPHKRQKPPNARKCGEKPAPGFSLNAVRNRGL
jgi:hypothetical protein